VASTPFSQHAVPSGLAKIIDSHGRQNSQRGRSARFAWAMASVEFPTTPEQKIGILNLRLMFGFLSMTEFAVDSAETPIVFSYGEPKAPPMDNSKRKPARAIDRVRVPYLQTQAVRRYPGRIPPEPVSLHHCAATMPQEAGRCQSSRRTKVFDNPPAQAAMTRTQDSIRTALWGGQ